MPTYISVNDGGTWRIPTNGLNVNDNGTWRAIRTVEVNDNGSWRTVMDTTMPPNQTITSSVSGGSSGICTLTIGKSDDSGQVVFSHNTDGGTVTDLTYNCKYPISTTDAVAGLYIRATQLSGDGLFDSGGTGWIHYYGVWVAWEGGLFAPIHKELVLFRSTAGTSNAVIKIDVAADSSGTPLIASGTYTLQATKA
jgi:hypothetical protein